MAKSSAKAAYWAGIIAATARAPDPDPVLPRERHLVPQPRWWLHQPRAKGNGSTPRREAPQGAPGTAIGPSSSELLASCPSGSSSPRRQRARLITSGVAASIQVLLGCDGCTAAIQRVDPASCSCSRPGRRYAGVVPAVESPAAPPVRSATAGQGHGASAASDLPASVASTRSHRGNEPPRMRP